MKKVGLIVTLVLFGMPRVEAQDTPAATEARRERRMQQLEQRIEELEDLVQRLLKRLGNGDGSAALKETSPSSPDPSPQTPPEKKKSGSSTLRANWDNGIKFDSPEGDFQLGFSGVMQNDWAFIGGDQNLESLVGPLQNGTEFRRARLKAEGQIYKNASFEAEYDLVGGKPQLKDIYMALHDLPVVKNIKFGHYKEPFNMDELTSDRHTTFLERSIPNEFAPSRNTGITLFNAEINERLTWAVGIFRDANAFADASGDGNFNVTGRVTGLPWYQEDGEKLLHLGLSFSHRNPKDNFLQIDARPEVHLAPAFADTGTLEATSENLFGTEAALVYGPLSFQGEFIGRSARTPAGPNLFFNSFYVQGNYFLTGEHRRYDRGDGVFGRVVPRSDFSGEQRGPGAWEVAFRFSRLDLEDQFVRGGIINDFTLGLNWYPNPNNRFMWNYVLADRESVGKTNIFQMRFQVDF